MKLKETSCKDQAKFHVQMPLVREDQNARAMGLAVPVEICVHVMAAKTATEKRHHSQNRPLQNENERWSQVLLH